MQSSDPPHGIHSTDWVLGPRMTGGAVRVFLSPLSGRMPTFVRLIAGRCSSCQPWALDDTGRSISVSVRV